MSRLFGYLGNDSALFDVALTRCENGLAVDLDKPSDGWGLGYYQGDRALFRKRPAELTGHVRLASLATDVQSSCVLSHVRLGTRGAPSPRNTQPYRFRNWLLAHIGEATFDDDLVVTLREALPDFLVRNVHGETDSEPALHLFFDFLRQRAHIDHPIVAVDALVESLRETVRFIHKSVRDNGSERPPLLNFLFTSGRMLMACNYSDSTLAYLELRGLTRTEAPLFAGHEPSKKEYPNYRGTFLTFDPYPSECFWITVPPHSILVIDENIEAHVAPING